MSTRVRSFSPVLMLLFLLPLRLSAGTTYTYTGPKYGHVHGAYTTSMSISGNFTLEGDPLNCSTECPFTPTTWSFNDGLQTLDNTNSKVSHPGTIRTDAKGTILALELEVELKTGGPATGSIQIISAPGEGLGDHVNYQPGPDAKSSAVTLQDGTWTTSH